jgi:hypothetical protein
MKQVPLPYEQLSFPDPAPENQDDKIVADPQLSTGKHEFSDEEREYERQDDMAFRNPITIRRTSGFVGGLVTSHEATSIVSGSVKRVRGKRGQRTERQTRGGDKTPAEDGSWSNYS